MLVSNATRVRRTRLLFVPTRTVVTVNLALCETRSCQSRGVTGVEQCVNRMCDAACRSCAAARAGWQQHCRLQQGGYHEAVMQPLCRASLITGEQRAPVWASKWHHMFSQTNRLNKCHLPIQDALRCVPGNQSLTLIKPFTPPKTPLPPTSPYKSQLSVISPCSPHRVSSHSFLLCLTIYKIHCGSTCVSLTHARSHNDVGDCAVTSLVNQRSLVNQKQHFEKASSGVAVQLSIFSLFFCP